jgi:hypothetical protein
MEYASFERARLALEHKAPDRLPFDLGGTLVSAVNVKTLRELRKHVRLPEHAEVCDKVYLCESSSFFKVVPESRRRLVIGGDNGEKNSEDACTWVWVFDSVKKEE